jgi:hypothetical protein
MKGNLHSNAKCSSDNTTNKKYRAEFLQTHARSTVQKPTCLLVDQVTQIEELQSNKLRTQAGFPV